ncbi:MAG: hypothetical protein AABY16_03405 [Nanoarchaeota archaeon]
MDKKEKIIQLRNAIRYPRDQTGDDRCWLDYRKAYALLPNTDKTQLERLPDYEKGMQICTAFYNKRKDVQSRIPRKIMPQAEWDKDLEDRSEAALNIILSELEVAARKHRDTPVEQLTLTDDKELYRLLPEYGRVPVDFTLPPREKFLGSAKDCAGCPNFWKSHANCPTAPSHNPHAWGPCKS